MNESITNKNSMNKGHGNKTSLASKSNDVINRITLFLIGMMLSGIIIVLFMKVLQIQGFILAIVAIFILNIFLYKKYRNYRFVQALNLGLLVTNLILSAFSLIVGIAFFSILGQIFQ